MLTFIRFMKFCILGNTIVILLSYTHAQVEAKPAETAQESYRVKALEPLRFGTFVAAKHGNNTIVIDPRNDARRTGPGVTELRGDYSAALFEIRGNAGETFIISLPERVEVTGGKAYITDLRSHPKERITLGRDGRGVFAVGGTLTLQPKFTGEIEAGLTVFIDRALE